MLRFCADTGDTLNVTACLIVLEDKKHPGRFRFHGTLRGDGAVGGLLELGKFKSQLNKFV